MARPPADDDLRADAAALAEHGSYRKAAKARGIAPGTLQGRIAQWRRRQALRGEVGAPPIPEIARPPEGFVVTRNSGEYDASGRLRRQWVGTERDAGEGFAVPPGHVVKGESALVDPDGRVLAKWIKTRASGAGAPLVEALRAAFAEFRGAAPACPAPAATDADLLTVYPLPDLHFGMLAWGRESGENYDIRIATDLALRRVEALVAQSRPSARAVLLGLGDYFHANGVKAATPASGNQLDVDGRWAKVFTSGARLATALIDRIARRHQSLEVVMLPGNHDPDAAIALTVALALFYADNKRIVVNQEPGIAWYHRFGRVLLGATHGHTMKPDQMAMMLATDRAADWGETSHRAFFFGHVHHESAREVGPVRVESFSAPAARDAWNAAAGFRAGRALSAITYHREDGEIGRHRVNIGPAAASTRAA
jgi:hypothetical protein